MTKRIISIFVLSLLVHPLWAQFKLDLEAGGVLGTNYNDIRIPNVGGTMVDVSDELKVAAKAFYRIRAGYTFRNRHNVSVLYAPLTVKYTGNLAQNVNFNNTLYTTSDEVRVDYKFNSYRITYRYDFIANNRWQIGAGLTGKIRDADIRFRSNPKDNHYSNVGFVPLVNFYVGYKPNERWTAILEGDALASKYGRAEDIFIGVSHHFTPSIGLKLGYRVVEGGADNDKIYNFTWINYASAGLLITL